MSNKLEDIAILCARECVKQHVGVDRLAMLISAYAYGADRSRTSRAPSEDDVYRIAELIEPQNTRGFRRIPVTFASGGSAADWSVIPVAFANLMEHVGDAPPGDWVHSFLDIHPFADGNGRCAFILYNWLLGSFNDPKPLPDFYAVTT